MPIHTVFLNVAIVVLVTATVATARKPGPVLFEGARVIVDASRPPIENGALLVENGRVVKIGPAGSVALPRGATRVALAGKTIMPAIVDAHIHLGYQVGVNFAAENFTRATIVDQLHRYAYAGIAAVLSLGTDPGDLPSQIRAEQNAGTLDGALYLTAGRGLAAPNAGPGTPELNASAYGVTTEDERNAYVDEDLRILIGKSDSDSDSDSDTSLFILRRADTVK